MYDLISFVMYVPVKLPKVPFKYFKETLFLKKTWLFKKREGTALVIQWLRLHAPNAEGPGSIPGQGTRSHMPQLKIPHATTKTLYSQINK